MASFGYVVYTDDNGNDYAIKMRSDVSTALGLTPTAMPAHPIFPHQRKRLRHIRAKAASGSRIFVPCVSLGDSHFTQAIGTTFSWVGGVTYTKMSQFGEQQTINR